MRVWRSEVLRSGASRTVPATVPAEAEGAERSAPGEGAGPGGPERLPAVLDWFARRSVLGEDLAVAYRKDPALQPGNALEVLLYQGVWAIWAHRVAHALHRAGVPVLPRLLSQVARALTGIEIHPAAVIGRRFFIDHGAGVVIGETAEVGDDVMMYHGVTLGGHGWWADAKGVKRHPTIGDEVTLGVGCSVLGAVTVGSGSRIGPHALVVDDVPPGSIVVAERGRCITRGGAPQPPHEGDLSPEWLGER